MKTAAGMFHHFSLEALYDMCYEYGGHSKCSLMVPRNQINLQVTIIYLSTERTLNASLSATPNKEQIV